MEVNPKSTLLDAAQPLDMPDLPLMGRVMVIAPHQDDETLGCGGTIALLRQADVPVHVLFITDGSLSHPNSQKYAAPKLAGLREREATEALHILNVNAEDITFLRLPDGHLPAEGEPEFDEAVQQIQTLLDQVKPETLFLPWQRDPHPDHRATWQLVNEAITRAGSTYRTLEYLIWLWERAEAADLPLPGEMQVWRMNIEPVLEQKRRAIAAHASQTTGLIDDDPEGFTLSPEVLAHFDTGEEVFVEKVPPPKGDNSLRYMYY